MGPDVGEERTGVGEPRCADGAAPEASAVAAAIITFLTDPSASSPDPQESFCRAFLDEARRFTLGPPQIPRVKTDPARRLGVASGGGSSGGDQAGSRSRFCRHVPPR